MNKYSMQMEIYQNITLPLLNCVAVNAKSLSNSSNGQYTSHHFGSNIKTAYKDASPPGSINGTVGGKENPPAEEEAPTCPVSTKKTIDCIFM